GNDIIEADNGSFDGSVRRINNVTYYLGDGYNKLFASNGDETIYAMGGQNDIYSGEGIDVVYATDGTGNISLGEGDDIVHIDGGDYKFYAGDGNDTFYVTAGTPYISGEKGNDVVFMEINSSMPLQLDEHKFKYGDVEITLADSTEFLNINDLSTETIIENIVSDYSWGAAGLAVTSAGVIDLTNAEFILPEGHLSLSAEGIKGDIQSQVMALTVVNTGTDDLADISVFEKDALEIAANYLENGGLYTANGEINLELEQENALLTLRSGQISTAASGNDIHLVADDVDFRAGSGTISGTGNLTLQAKTDGSVYKIGAVESNTGNDFSDAGPDGAMDMSMRDLEAIADGFALITIGNDDPDTVMYIGDLKDRVFENFNKIKADDDGIPIRPYSGNIVTYTEETS
ncbi:MAG: hypothetical protein OMM_13656, partial [Candidatus Magnetoglobus multicellularis str. Araruama]